MTTEVYCALRHKASLLLLVSTPLKPHFERGKRMQRHVAPKPFVSLALLVSTPLNLLKAYLRRNTLFFKFCRHSYDQRGRSLPLKLKRLVLLVSNALIGFIRLIII